MRPSPRSRINLGCVLLAACALAGCGRSPTSSRTAGPDDSAAATSLMKVGFQLDWFPTPEHGGHFEALAKNYYRDAGLDVSIAPGGPSTFPMQEVATGRMQFAIGRCDDVILGVKQGLPLLVVCAQMQHDPQAIMVHQGSPVKSFRDLDGKSVMAGPGSNWITFVQNRYGIKFNILPMDFGMARFLADKNFIQQCFISNEPYFAELRGVKTEVMLIADAGFDPYRVIFTSRSFARDHPEAVRAFVAATIHGWTEFLHGDATEARAKIQAADKSETAALMDYSIAAMTRYKLVEGDPAKGERTGMLTAARLNGLLQTMVDLHILETALPLEKFVTFKFLPGELTAGQLSSSQPPPSKLN
jgi:NitT/TauT family transport system substrate-binding protein